MNYDYEAWLDMRIPGWRDEFETADEAMVELGLAEPTDLEAERGELDYSEQALWGRMADYLDDE